MFGYRGEVGAYGDVGPEGKDGRPGVQGELGVKGTKGSQGRFGLDGADGQPGEQVIMKWLRRSLCEPPMVKISFTWNLISNSFGMWQGVATQPAGQQAVLTKQEVTNS